MRTLIKSMLMTIMLIVITACGSGGGGGGSSSGGNAAPDHDAFLAKTIYNFHLVVESCNGATFTAVAFTDETWPEENRNDWNGGIGPAGTTNIVVTGRELNWEVIKVSGNCPTMTMKLYRQLGAGLPGLIETKVIVLDGDSDSITY